jgi:hypothetical protein
MLTQTITKTPQQKSQQQQRIELYERKMTERTYKQFATWMTFFEFVELSNIIKDREIDSDVSGKREM